MLVQHRMQMACQDAEGTNRDGAPCFTKDIQMNIICVSEEPGDKYRVQQTVDGLVEIVLFCLYLTGNNQCGSPTGHNCPMCGVPNFP